MQEEEKNITPPKKNSILKKVLKIIAYIILGVVGLNVLLYILLSIPAVQEKVINFALDKIKPIVKTEVSIDKVHISLFNHVNLQGVYIEDQAKDTLLFAQELDVRINIWRLIGNELKINSINLNNPVINVSQKTPDSDFNFQFLIDAFASTDTISEPSSNPMKIALDDIVIRNARINYDILSEPQTPDTFNVSHISVTNFDARLNFQFTDINDLNASFESFSLKEKSGLIVKDIIGEVESKGNGFNSEKLSLELPTSKLEVTDLKYNLLNNEFNVQVNSNIQPTDLLFFMPQLRSLKNEINLNTHISGKLPFIEIKQFDLDYGEDLVLGATASVEDYEHYGNSEIRLLIDKFRIKPKAIEQLARIGDSTYVNPDVLTVVEYIRLKGSVEGKLNNLAINADAWTNQGSIQLKGNAATDTTFEDFKIKANLRTQNFNLAPFVGNEVGVKRISMHTNLDLQSINNLALKADGAITSVQYQDETFSNIRFKAQYDPSVIKAWLNADLPIGSLLAEGSMTQGRNSKIKFDVDARNLMVDYFYKNPAWQNPKLNLHLAGDLIGTDINTMQGHAVVDTLMLWGDNLHFDPGKFELESGINKDTVRYISLTSSVVDANISGKYNFTTLPVELTNIMYAYLPSFFSENKRLKNYQNNFNVDITVKNSEDLGKIFALPVDIITPLSVKGEINTIENVISFDGNIPFIRFGENEVKNTVININNNSSPALILKAKANLMQGNGYINVNLDTDISSDTIGVDMHIVNNNSPYDVGGELKAEAHFEYEENDLVSYLNLLPTQLNFGVLKFSTLPSKIVNKGDKTTISNFGMALNDKRYFGIDGTISASKEDSIQLYFDHAQIGDILTAFNVNNIKAEANGGVIVTNTLDQPELYTEGLNLADIIIFGDTLGTLSLQSEWNNVQQAINFDASLKSNIATSNINGHVSTQQDSMNIDVNVDRLSIKWLQPFMADVLSRTAGSVSAKMTLDGKLASPIANGWLGFNDMYIGVDFTNVTYHISDTIKVFPDKIGFRNLRIEDNNKNAAVASALISHENFQNFKYLLNLDLNNFLILNTSNRTDSLFYGKLLASGNVKVKGDDSEIDVDMNIRNEKNSSINITVPDVSEASSYQSIVYINVPQEDSLKNVIPSAPSKPLPIDLNMNLQINSGITLGVIINPETGDAMQVKGSGEIKFSYDMLKDNMNTYGEYILSDGSVRLRLQNLLTLEFKVQEGSKLDLIGDPMRTNFNITAYRRVRASLNTLDESFSSSKVYVDCVLGIKGNMQKMDLTYDIRLPDADDDTRSKIQSLINTDDEKTKNFAYLVATGSFYPRNSNDNFSGNMWTSVASGALSKGFDALFGNILGDKWEVGTEISSSDGSFSDVDMMVNVSTRLFDDKLKLNTNLGYRTEQTSGTSDNTFVGDFDIEYELSKLWKLKVYNKTNDQFYKTAETTQGIGIVYTKEAKTIKELFRSFRRKTNDNDRDERRNSGKNR